MSDSLLNALQRYSSRPDYNPIENFTTEAFAWLLRNNQEAERAFLNLIEMERSPSLADWRTQVPCRAGIADIVGFSDGLPKVVVEVKVWASGDKDQVEGYAKALAEEHPGSDSIKKVFLSPGFQDETADAKITWASVWTTLNSLPNEKKDPRIQDFLEFLDAQELSPGRSLADSVFHSAHDYFELQEGIEKVRKRFKTVLNNTNQELRQNVDKFWPIFGGEIPRGRAGIGVVFKNNAFVFEKKRGAENAHLFFLFWSNHPALKNVLSDGPVFCILLFQNQYRDQYRKEFSDLKTYIEEQHKGWRFISGAGIDNEYRALISRPAIEFLKNSNGEKTDTNPGGITDQSLEACFVAAMEVLQKIRQSHEYQAILEKLELRSDQDFNRFNKGQPT